MSEYRNLIQREGIEVALLRAAGPTRPEVLSRVYYYRYTYGIIGCAEKLAKVAENAPYWREYYIRQHKQYAGMLAYNRRILDVFDC